MKTSSTWRSTTRAGLAVLALVFASLTMTAMFASPASARKPADNANPSASSATSNSSKAKAKKKKNVKKTRNKKAQKAKNIAAATSYSGVRPISGCDRNAAAYNAASAGANGCTSSPDYGIFPVQFNFHQACNTHDACYDQGYHGGRNVSRADCDRQFYNNMANSCDRLHRDAWNRKSCRNLAGIYYATVSVLGTPFYNNPYLN